MKREKTNEALVKLPAPRARIRALSTEDPHSRFRQHAASEILDRFGRPYRLLTSSAKSEKCAGVGVMNRVLFLTSGIFCPGATQACRSACLGHTSGRMQLPSSALTRDLRSAWYLEEPGEFLRKLDSELTELTFLAAREGTRPAVRLNGTSDLPWEIFHPEVFENHPTVQFFDYTKLLPRMRSFCRKDSWPANYHLTFSGDGRHAESAREILALGGNVAVVFWPTLPKTWWDAPVMNGDLHDARFLDPARNIVGLLAKGLARVDLDGFVARPCPVCQSAQELTLLSVSDDTHRTTTHSCSFCGHHTQARWSIRRQMSS